MSRTLRIAVDAMGGDKAPEMVIRGADVALERDPDLAFILVGDEALIRPLLAKTRRLKTSDPEIIHTDKSVGAAEKPSVALRTGRGSSMRLAIDLVGNQKADCVVSAGNTGALMAMSKFVFRTVPGIDRPAIAGFFPTLRGESAMLDLGANAIGARHGAMLAEALAASNVTSLNLAWNELRGAGSKPIIEFLCEWWPWLRQRPRMLRTVSLTLPAVAPASQCCPSASSNRWTCHSMVSGTA